MSAITAIFLAYSLLTGTSITYTMIQIFFGTIRQATTITYSVKTVGFVEI